jgi:signal peptidase
MTLLTERTRGGSPYGLDRRAPVPPRPGRPRVSVRRRLASVALWTVIVVCGSAYAASLAVPLWFQAHGQRLLIVTSGSMSGSAEGAFDAGDAVVMRHITDASQLRVGQVASFWPVGSDTLVTHRIIGVRSLPVLRQDEATGRMVPTLDPATNAPVERPYILTKGDANPSPDPNATPLSQVRGVVLGVHPRWGFVLDWARSADGRLVMLGPPLAALAALEVIALVAERRAQARRVAATEEQRRIDDLLLS